MPGEALGVQEVETPKIQESRYMNVISLSAIHTGYLYHSQYSLFSFVLEAEWTPRHIVLPERFSRWKNPNNPPANKRTRDFLACSKVSQPIALPPAPQILTHHILNIITPSKLNVAQCYLYLCTQHKVYSRKITETAGHWQLYPEAVPTAPLIMAVVVQLILTHYTNKHNIHFLNHFLL
jgi:hypothetical protein